MTIILNGWKRIALVITTWLACALPVYSQAPPIRTSDEAVDRIFKKEVLNAFSEINDAERLSTEEKTSKLHAIILEKAKHGDPNAQYSYALEVSKKKPEQADYWMRKAAEQGLAPAQFILGAGLVEGLDGRKIDVAEGRRWMLLGANQDFADAQTILGSLCFKQSDFKCAVEWYKKAADVNLDATDALGRMYYFGQGMSVDKVKARSLLTKAAAGNIPTAQALLGEMYFQGEGGEQNIIRARDLELEAIKNGYTNGTAMLAEIYLHGGPGFPPNAAEARKWTLKSAEAGNKVAMLDIGYTLSSGQGGPTDYKEAMRWFLQASKAGIPEADNNIGVMYQRGYGVAVDTGTARMWYRKAASKGFAPAKGHSAVSNNSAELRRSSGSGCGPVATGFLLHQGALGGMILGGGC